MHFVWLFCSFFVSCLFVSWCVNVPEVPPVLGGRHDNLLYNKQRSNKPNSGNIKDKCRTHTKVTQANQHNAQTRHQNKQTRERKTHRNVSFDFRRDFLQINTVSGNLEQLVRHRLDSDKWKHTTAKCNTQTHLICPLKQKWCDRVLSSIPNDQKWWGGWKLLLVCLLCVHEYWKTTENEKAHSTIRTQTKRAYRGRKYGRLGLELFWHLIR